MRFLDHELSLAGATGKGCVEPCLVDGFLTSPPKDDVDPFVPLLEGLLAGLVGDFAFVGLRATNGCTARSSPGAGPVDRMKSAKSRIDSLLIRGSRALGFAMLSLPLDDGTGPCVLELVRLG